MAKRRTAETSLAYAWTCDELGAENFERAVVYEFSAEERAELADRGAAGPGNWVSHPERVTCPTCRAEFDAKHFSADDDSLVEQDSE